MNEESTTYRHLLPSKLLILGGTTYFSDRLVRVAFIDCEPNTLQLPFGGAELNETLPLKSFRSSERELMTDIAFRSINISLLRSEKQLSTSYFP